MRTVHFHISLPPAKTSFCLDHTRYSGAASCCVLKYSIGISAPGSSVLVTAISHHRDNQIFAWLRHCLHSMRTVERKVRGKYPYQRTWLHFTPFSKYLYDSPCKKFSTWPLISSAILFHDRMILNTARAERSGITYLGTLQTYWCFDSGSEICIMARSAVVRL